MLKSYKTYIYNTFSTIRRNIYIDLNGNLQNTFFLASTPRSGSTWIAETIQRLTNSRLIFEPFHGRVNSGLPKVTPLYLRPHANYPEYQPQIDKILRGKIRSEYSDAINKKIIVKNRLIKAIHANLMLPWLVNNYPVIKCTYLIRHPFPTALSLASMAKKRTPEDFLRQLEYLHQEELLQDFLFDKSDLIKSAITRFEQYILRWCIEQIVPLKLLNKQSKVLVIFYENCCLDKAQTILRISKHLDVKITESYKNELISSMKKPSATAFLGVRTNPGELAQKRQKHENHQKLDDLKLLIDWRQSISRYISESEIDYGLYALKAFGLDRLYTDQLLPHVDSNQVFDLFY